MTGLQSSLRSDSLRLAQSTQTHIWLIAVCFVQFCVSLWAVSKGLEWAFLPLIVCGGLVCLVRPRWGLFLLVPSWFYRVSLVPPRAIYAADFIAVLIVIGYVIHRIGSDRPLIERTPLNWLIGLLMASFGISVALSVAKVSGLVNWLHHAQIFMLYFAIIGLVDETDIRRLTKTFIAFCVGLALVNVVAFVVAGGLMREFGPAGVRFSGFLALAGPVAVVASFMDNSRWKRWLWTFVLVIIYAGQVSNQSRGAMIQLVSGTVFAGILAFRWSQLRNRPEIRARILAHVLGLTIAGILLAVISYHFVVPVAERYSTQRGNPLATAEMRVFLWRTAIQTFFQHPIFGTGLAQEHIWGELMPSMRFDPWYIHTKGLSAHNALLAYLAGTGIVGSAILFALLAKAFSIGRRIFKRTTDDLQAMWQLGIWSAVFVIVTRYLYEGHLFYSTGGMSTVVFFAFLIRLTKPANGRPKSVAEAAS